MIYDPHFYWLQTSYVHYLGSGTRYLGAGSPDYSSYVWNDNEAIHNYVGTHDIRASAINASGHNVTVNAHATF